MRIFGPISEVMTRTLGFVAAVSCVASTGMAELPVPDVKRPVDYAAWMNAGFSARARDNAADLYRQTAQALGTVGLPRDVLALADSQDWTEADETLLRNRLEQRDSALEIFCAATRKPECYFELKSESGALVQVVLPELKGLRDAAILLCLRARLRLASGETERAIDDLECVTRAGRHLQSQPMLVDYLVGLNVYGTALDVILRAPRLSKGPLPYDLIMSRVVADENEPRRIHRQLVTEQLCTWDLIQRNLRDRDGDGLYETLETPREIDPAGPSVPLDRPQTIDRIVRETEQCFGRFQAAAREPDFAKARPLLESVQKDVAAKKGSLLALTTEQLDRAILLQYRALAYYRGTRLAMALTAHHAAHQKWPASLKEALPSAPDDALIDPFSGQPFAYEIRNGTPFLYSVGENGLDDGGQAFLKNGNPAWGNTGDFVFCPRE